MLGSLKDKLLKTSRALRERLDDLLRSGKPRDQLLAELEEILIQSDMGVQATEKIIASVRDKTRKEDTFPVIRQALQEEVVRILSRYPAGLAVGAGPAVIMVVGANGGGKTTSLAKLARYFRAEGRRSSSSPPTPSGQPPRSNWSSGEKARSAGHPRTVRRGPRGRRLRRGPVL